MKRIYLSLCKYNKFLEYGGYLSVTGRVLPVFGKIGDNYLASNK